MADQQQESTVGLSAQYNISVLVNALMDLQQLIRTFPGIIARAEQLGAENEALKVQLAALAPKAVEATESQSA
jgi:hypothetical protein